MSKPEIDTDEFLQSRLEKKVREQYELHGWATAVSVANPLDILIMFEEQNEEFEPLNQVRTIISKGRIL